MIAAVVSFVLRVVLAVAGLIFMLFLMAVALVTVLLLVLWSLIRGRRPQVDMSRFKAARGQFNAGRRSSQPAGEVVDVEVREVPNVRPRVE